MPTLHLRLVPTANNGIQKVFLSNPIRSQDLTLQSVVVSQKGNGYNQSAVYVRIPFLSSNQFHSGDKKGFLTFPVGHSSGLDHFSFGSGLRLECDHIQEVFECQLLDASLAGITDDTHFTSIDLYFSYKSAGLF